MLVDEVGLIIFLLFVDFVYFFDDSKNIFCLDISMDQVFLVHVIEPFDDVPCDVESLI